MHRVPRRRSVVLPSAVVLGALAACSSTSRSASTAATGSGASTSSSTGTHAAGGSAGSSHVSSSNSSSTSGIVFPVGSSGAGGSDGGCSMGSLNCMNDKQCDDDDPNTIDKCIISGGEVPVGTCVHVECDGGVSCSVDTTCSEADAGQVYPPYVPLYPPDVPSSCANGFEVCDAFGAPTYVVHSKSAAGSRALTLDLDFATYLAPDGLLITGIDGCGRSYVLFDSCRLQTADESESSYTDGGARPSDVTIRQFHLTLREGTTQLSFDFSNVESPMYFQILGLCDFTLSAVPGVGWSSLVP